MSLIHRSLEQLRRAKAARTAPGIPLAAPRPKGKRRPALLLALLLLGLGLAALAGTWALREYLGLPLPWSQPEMIAAPPAENLEALKARVAARQAEEAAASAQPAPSGETPQAAEDAPPALPAQRPEAAVASLPAPAPESGTGAALPEAPQPRQAERAAETSGTVPPHASALPAPELPLSSPTLSLLAAAASSSGAPLDMAPASLPARVEEAPAPVSTPVAQPPTPGPQFSQGGEQYHVALEEHFARQAQRNQQVADLERALVLALRGGDQAAAAKGLAALLERVGRQSATGLKWQGYFALRDERPAEAEAAYRDALALAPGDMEAGYNLLLALVRQGKREQARQLFGKLLTEHPTDERLLSFTEVLR